jgi:hypothetical protein
MLPEEAQWLGAAILSFPHEQVFPLLDVASASDHFRKIDQPWIDQFIFAPIRQAGGRVVHTDILDLPGVDLVGDLYDPVFFEQLRALRFRSLLCANVLEHLSDPAFIAKRLLSMLEPGGLLFVTVPHGYPYHAGPIDTLLRPNVAELHEFFPGTKLISGKIVQSKTWWEYLNRKPIALAKKIARLALPFYRPKGWLTVAAHFLWLWRRFSVTCLVLEKEK